MTGVMNGLARNIIGTGEGGARVMRLSLGMKTRILRWIRGTDVARWRDQDNLFEAWNERTALIADLIPAGASVIELGAGRMVLKDLLAPGCRYTPSDIVKRSDETQLIDLNKRRLPDLPAHDYAVFSGVLEYLHDIPRVIRHVKRSADAIILSYAVTDYHPDRRRDQGWVNDLSAADLEALMVAEGWCIYHTTRWRNQMILAARRMGSETSASRCC